MLEEGDQCGEAQRGKDRMASLAPREVGRHQVLKRHRRAGQAIPWAVQQLARREQPPWQQERVGDIHQDADVVAQVAGRGREGGGFPRSLGQTDSGPGGHGAPATCCCTTNHPDLVA